MYINRVLCKSFIIRCLHSAQVFLLKKEYTWNITGNTSEEIQNFPSSSLLSVFRINFPKVECLMQPIQRHSQKEFQQECVKIWNSVVHIHPMIPIQDRPENRKNERSATPSVGLSCTPVRVSRYETRRPPRVLICLAVKDLAKSIRQKRHSEMLRKAIILRKVLSGDKYPMSTCSSLISSHQVLRSVPCSLFLMVPRGILPSEYHSITLKLLSSCQYPHPGNSILEVKGRLQSSIRHICVE